MGDVTMDDILDGLSLWGELKPQSGEDWIAVAERFINTGDDPRDAAPLFAGLVLAIRERDRLRDLLEQLSGVTPARFKNGPAWERRIYEILDEALNRQEAGDPV